MRVIITRPLEDAPALAAKLAALGHTAIVHPLITIVARHGVTIPRHRWQAIAATSANALRALDGHDDLKSLPLLTVGPHSLAAAKAAGFTSAEAHGGDVTGLAAHIRRNLRPEAGPILYLSGAETAGDLQSQLSAAGFDCTRVILYDAIPATSLGDVAAAPGDLAVLLYSPRTARIWRSLVTAHGLTQNAVQIRHLCLSANVAAVLPQAWPREIAASPTEAAMLALLEPFAGTR